MHGRVVRAVQEQHKRWISVVGSTVGRQTVSGVFGMIGLHARVPVVEAQSAEVEPCNHLLPTEEVFVVHWSSLKSLLATLNHAQAFAQMGYGEIGHFGRNALQNVAVAFSFGDETWHSHQALVESHLMVTGKSTSYAPICHHVPPTQIVN